MEIPERRSPTKKILIVLGTVILLLAVAAGALIFLVDVNRHKPRIEAAVSDSLGLAFRIDGKAGLGFFPGPHVTLDNVGLRSREADVLRTDRVSIGVRLFPLLRGELAVTEFTLEKPEIGVEKRADGSYNFEKPGKPPGEEKKGAATGPLAFTVQKVSVSKGRVIYRDLATGSRIVAEGVDLTVNDFSMAGGEMGLIAGLSGRGELKVRDLRAEALPLSNVQVGVNASKGVLEFRPVTMKLFGGSGEGSARIDLSGEKTRVETRFALKDFRANEAVSALADKKGAEGVLTLLADLKTAGKTGDEIKRALSGEISLKGDSFSMADPAVRAKGIDIALRNLALGRGRAGGISQELSFLGDVKAGEIQAANLTLSGVSGKIKAGNGIYDLRPLSMRLFGGSGEGSIRFDTSGDKTGVEIRYTLSNFRAEQALAAVSKKKGLSGPMTASPVLSMRGLSADEIKRSLSGAISVRGENLVLQGMDLDEALEQAKKMQQGNLADLGAGLFTVPLGGTLLQGYNYGSGLASSVKKDGSIRILVSDWRVQGGMAEAADVALATARNRMALKGKLNLVREEFDGMTVAVLDPKGCAVMQQRLDGPFANPRVSKLNLLETVAEPVLKQFGISLGALRGGRCEVFYSGAVPQPK